MFQVNRKLLKNFEKLILFFLKIINIFKKKKLNKNLSLSPYKKRKRSKI